MLLLFTWSWSNIFGRSSWVQSVFRDLSVISVSVGVSSGLPGLSPLRMRSASSPPSTRRGARKDLTKMLGVAGGRSLVTGWNRLCFFFLFSGLDASRRTFESKSVAWFPGRCATWSWRNRSRTPSESSGATAPCQKQRGPRTKVSVSRTDTRCRWTLKRAGGVSGAIRAVKWLNGDSRGVGAY